MFATLIWSKIKQIFSVLKHISYCCYGLQWLTAPKQDFWAFLGTSCHITVTQVGCCYNGSLDQNRNFLAVFSIVPRSGTVRSQNWSQVNTSCPKWCHFTVLGFSSTSWRYWWLQRLPALKRDDFRCHWAHSATFWSREGSELVPS